MKFDLDERQFSGFHLSILFIATLMVGLWTGVSSVDTPGENELIIHEDEYTLEMLSGGAEVIFENRPDDAHARSFVADTGDASIVCEFTRKNEWAISDSPDQNSLYEGADCSVKTESVRDNYFEEGYDPVQPYYEFTESQNQTDDEIFTEGMIQEFYPDGIEERMGNSE